MSYCDLNMNDVACQNGIVNAGAHFAAGLVFGLTADNHLTEIEACFTGGELMFHEVRTGIADIKKGGWDNDIQAALEFGLVALQVPQALNTCESMGDDLTAIEEWAQIFTDPTKLAAQVSKHYLFHKTEIKADIASVESDWSAGLFFKAGADLADLMTLAVGPIESAVGDALYLPPVIAVPDFTAGLIFGFTGNDHREELEGCMTDVEPLVSDAQQFLSDIKNLHLIAGIQDLGDIIWMLPDAVSSCGELEDLQADIDSIMAWAEIFENPTAAAKIASKNWLFHGVRIKRDIASEEADWASGDYYNAGLDSANVMLGLIPLDSVNVDIDEYILQ